MPSVQEMQADLQTAQAHGDGALAQHIAGLIQQSQRQSSGAIEGEPDLGGVGNSILAGGVHFVHQLPLVGDAAITASRWANDQLNGRKSSWQQANVEAHQTINSAQQAHPIASTVGGIAGGVDTALIGGGAMKAAGGGEAVFNALPKAATVAQHAANAGRMAAAAATAGAAQGAAQRGGEQLAGGNPAAAPAAAAQGALAGGAAGAVLGPVAGAATTAVAKIAAPLATKTAMALSKVFGENASDLQAAWKTFAANTGRAPSMAELATLKQAGQIAGAARDSTPITIALRNASDDASRARSDTMQATFAPQATSSGELANVKTAQGDVDYAASRAQPDFSISADESPELGGVSPADHFAAEILPQAGLGKADRVRIMNGLQDGALSSQDAQLVRSGLNDSLNRNFSPAVKGALSDLDAFLAAPGNETPNAALTTARANYAANAQTEAGAAHGESILGSQTAPNFGAEAASKPNVNPNFQAGLASGARSRLAGAASAPSGAEGLAQRLATDDSLHAKLATTFGQGTADAWRRLGRSETAAAANLAAYGNRTAPSDDADVGDVKKVLTAAAAMHSPIGGVVYKTVHLAKMGLGIGMPPKVQEKVAEYLSDPKMVGQGINILRKAGATNTQLRQLAIGVAQTAGAISGGAISGIEEQQEPQQ